MALNQRGRGVIDAQEDGLHPLAIGSGILIFMIAVFFITMSSHQREQLKLAARTTLRKKQDIIKTVTTGTGSNSSPGASTSAKEQVGKLPTFAKTAAETGNARMMRRFIGADARDVNARSNENMTALHYASREGQTEIIKMLIDAGVDVNILDERRISPLHLAALGGQGHMTLHC